MTDRIALLDHAEEVLDGKVALGSSGPRTAALLARCALEDWLDEQSATWAPTSIRFLPPGRNSSCWRSWATRYRGAQARRIWEALSRTVHHHAYELQPSVAEVRHLVEQVRWPRRCCRVLVREGWTYPVAIVA